MTTNGWLAKRNVTRTLLSAARLPLVVHRDERGSISIASVFALLFLVMLLGMVMNAGRQVDQKVKLQNAADAATYSGSVVLTRGMNTLAFTNHLEADVFALTAFMREARDRHAESLTPEILANWERIAPVFQSSEFPKFADLGLAIEEKVPHEREMIFTFSEWAAAASELMLPVLEDILANYRIPEFQRALVDSTPRLAQYAADEVARRHGQSWPRPMQLRGVLWRTNADPVGGVSEAQRRTLPVVDPEMDMIPGQNNYIKQARRERSRLAHKYLAAWNDESLESFDRYGKMSQFSNLFRIFTRGQLKQMLDEEYRESNLPFQIRTSVADLLENGIDVNKHLQQDFSFVGVVYGEKMVERIPGIFKNPVNSDTQAYAETMIFVPRRRLIKVPKDDSSNSTGGGPRFGGIPGERVALPVASSGASSPSSAPSNSNEPPEWYVRRQWEPRYPEQWDLLNQNWISQLTPATTPQLMQILSATPYVNGAGGAATPDLQSLTEQDVPWLSHH